MIRIQNQYKVCYVSLRTYDTCKTVPSLDYLDYLDFVFVMKLSACNRGVVRIPAGIPANIYLFKVTNRNTRKRCEICSKLTIKKPERRVSIVDFEQVNIYWDLAFFRASDCLKTGRYFALLLYEKIDL